MKVRGTAWEGRPENVRVMYSKARVRELNPEYHGTRGIQWE